jgi:hypothetical protein
MTSHREGPSISKDPVADNTDLYAFISPDRQDTVTIIANYIPGEEPAGGPNFYGFGDDVLYEIRIDNDGDGWEEITYQFYFRTNYTNPNTFLYNTGPIGSLTDPNWNVRQTYTVNKVTGTLYYDEGQTDAATATLGKDLPSPPVNVGPRSTPNYASLASAAINTLSDGSIVFAGQRADGFYVDLGSIFDLGTLRPFENLHLISTAAASGVNTLKGYNVHSIAIQVPITSLTADGKKPTDPTKASSSIGIWATASRRKLEIRPSEGRGDINDFEKVGPWTQISRLGNPLINEVLIPIGRKDAWNRSLPVYDSQYLSYYSDPQLQRLLTVLYPGVFPNLAQLLKNSASSRQRADLIAILLTGVPNGVVPGWGGNFTGTVQADQLRLNLAIAPTITTTNPDPKSNNLYGVVGGDIGGFPNGRRVFDNTVAVELRAVAGATYPLVAPTYVADAASGALLDGTTADQPYLSSFPYLPTPYDGYSRKHD